MRRFDRKSEVDSLENLGGGKFVEHIILDQKLDGHELQPEMWIMMGTSTSARRHGVRSPGMAREAECTVDYLENRLR